MKMANLLMFWVGIMLIMISSIKTASLASIPKNIGVLAVLDLSGLEELPYNTRVKLAVRKWNMERIKCSDARWFWFWYENKCHPLNFDSELCDVGSEVIVLEKPKEQGTTFSLRPICKKVQCGYDSVWWPPLGKCIKDEEAREICGDYGSVEYDIFDDAYCECAYASGNLYQDDKCYNFYDRGPCSHGEIFKPSGHLSGMGKCYPKLNYAEVGTDNKEKITVESVIPEIAVETVEAVVSDEPIILEDITDYKPTNSEIYESDDSNIPEKSLDSLISEILENKNSEIPERSDESLNSEKFGNENSKIPEKSVGSLNSEMRKLAESINPIVRIKPFTPEP